MFEYDDAEQVFLDRIEEVRKKAKADGEEMSYSQAMSRAEQEFPADAAAYLRSRGVPMAREV